MTAETAWQRRTRREAERAAHVAEHGNRCELCGNEPKSRGLSEDHDHKTGAHRGWLCYRCNRALPTYATLEWLRKAVVYLETARRKLGENDPGRYEIAVLIGPCTLAEATSLSERVSKVTQGYLGAVVSLTTWREDDSAAADEPGETP